MNRLALEPSRDPTDYAFVHRLRTRFAETDAMGVIHHASYLAVRSGKGDDSRDFPVLEVSLRYRKPLRFDEEVDVALVIGAVTGTTFQIAYLVSVGGEVRATAVTVHGCVDRRGRPARLPAWVGEKFGPA
jgi:acyl-CoA thioester hydrolase